MPSKIAAVITGASDGIGRAMAFELARRGARLGLIARRRELLEQTASELRTAGATEVRVAALDITDSTALREALTEFEREFGGITHFVANAGVSGRSRPDQDCSADLRRCFEVNVLAAIDGIEWVKERMVARGSGTLAGISSVAAARGLPDSGAYSASKAALSTYLESLRVDLAPYGVRVVTIAPGYIDTALTRKNKGTMPFLMGAGDAARIFVEALLRGRRSVIAPWQYGWLVRGLRAMPDPIYDRIIRRFVGGIRGNTPDSRKRE